MKLKLNMSSCVTVIKLSGSMSPSLIPSDNLLPIVEKYSLKPAAIFSSFITVSPSKLISLDKCWADHAMLGIFHCLHFQE